MHKFPPVLFVIPRIERTARRISDPLERLRFLQTAAPKWQLKQVARRKFMWARPLVFSLATLLTAGCFAMARWKAEASIQSLAASAASQLKTSSAVSTPVGMALSKPGSKLEIWQVEKTGPSETYSNGLRIDNRFATVNHPRSYRAFSARSADIAGERRTTPAGIVYHTTESLQAPFEAARNGELKQVGESLLEYIRRRKAYNFVIDRFGRVFRMVREEDAAEHAGYSVWADEDRLYVNLNESFLGVALETRTQPGQVEATVTAAQIRATAMLTEMLRGRYQIPARNCVTHAQVSVSPTRMLAGYHMDWASSFPFAEIGLPDNYALPLPSVEAFGFERDANYTRAAGVRLSAGAGLGERALAARAAAIGVGVFVYRQRLQKLYRQRLAATRGATVSHEGD